MQTTRILLPSINFTINYYYCIIFFSFSKSKHN